VSRVIDALSVRLTSLLYSGVKSIPSAIWYSKMLVCCFVLIYFIDPQKRAAFDRYGSDPESRFGGMSSGGGPSFATSPFGGGGGFDGEMSPEDLFNMFFGGGGGASPFATFGGGGPGERS
jgi:DnaJ family protein B protein 12